MAAWAAAVAMTAVAAILLAGPAGATDRSASASGWTPIAGEIGWSACEPITWSIDPGALSPSMARRQVPAISWAFDQWSAASGLHFDFAGVTDTTYEPASADLRPVAGAPQRRHVYLTWLDAGTAPALAGRTSGFAAPSMVEGDAINGGRAVFKAAYVASVSRSAPAKARALYLHEIGHILGLGHSTVASDRMYPLVSAGVRLGAGDRAGIRALTRACG